MPAHFLCAHGTNCAVCLVSARAAEVYRVLPRERSPDGYMDVGASPPSRGEAGQPQPGQRRRRAPVRRAVGRERNLRRGLRSEDAVRRSRRVRPGRRPDARRGWRQARRATLRAEVADPPGRRQAVESRADLGTRIRLRLRPQPRTPTLTPAYGPFLQRRSCWVAPCSFMDPFRLQGSQGALGMRCGSAVS